MGGGQFLGIVEPGRDIVRIENDGGGHNRPGKRTSSGLVSAGDRKKAALGREFFELEIGR
ncbi:hypothetical protein GCM10007920_43850 [Ciceribacter naphthalenivorans]|uniref:Uncharacterized protein n=2 Tax=Alphaproteobacteria TaxID=28211 RepID=A0A512HI05_9HYPH|nr:hypothetical protein RNA01_20070 [Ciceribacter naphthalenivorans]GLR24591.1 hypothetical protein GCM10007920_43850 [Ciceribacter naphthalenivorans]GLT07447.1 hypothetical protein GCM10007926_43850 [Sphingomonas psychrolutea]